MKDKWEEHGCDFKNEAECEEELEEDGLNPEEIKEKHWKEE